MMHFFEIARTLVMAAVATSGTQVVTDDPGAAFRDALLARADAGWHIADLSIDAEPAARAVALGKSQLMHVAVTMHDGQRAERIVLSFEDGEGDLVEMRREPGDLPGERRHYTDEALLMNALREGTVLRVEWVCGLYLMTDGPSGGAPLEESAYYVSEGKVRGKVAQKRLAGELRRGDLLYVAAAEPPGDVVFVVADGASSRHLQARLADDGTVEELVIQRRPFGHGFQRYARGPALQSALEGTRVERVSLDDDGGSLLILSGESPFPLPISDFEFTDDEGCGC